MAQKICYRIIIAVIVLTTPNGVRLHVRKRLSEPCLTRLQLSSYMRCKLQI